MSNLYYGGYGNYMAFTVADNKEQAIHDIGIKINAPFLPITAVVVDDIDGYTIKPTKQGVTELANAESGTVENDAKTKYGASARTNAASRTSRTTTKNAKRK